MMLPRVKLNSKTIAPANNDNLATTVDGTVSADNWQKDEHVGLVVYHISGDPNPECAEIVDGVYVWTGEKWIPLIDDGTSEDTRLATITLKNGIVTLTDEQVIDIASGNDNRGISISDLNLDIEWTGTALTLTPTGETSGSYSDPSDMTISPTWTSGTDVSITSKPENMAISFNDMASLITTTNPWKSRQWELKFKVVDNCGKDQIQTIIVNQTNFAIGVTDVSGVLYRFEDFGLNQALSDTNDKQLNLRSNTEWTATIGGDKPDIITSTTLADGAESKDGTYSQTSFIFTPQEIAGGKYETATITFSDHTNTPKAAKDVVVGVFSCLGTEDMSSVTITADNTETQNGHGRWSGEIVRHERKTDTGGDLIYDEFYSAEFGAAGRWMTTNLVAYKYDLNGGALNNFYTGGDPDILFNNNGNLLLLQENDINGSDKYVKARYSYPGNRPIADGESPSTQFLANPRLGLLYTWDAASAGKGGATGNENVDNPGVLNEYGFFPQGTNSGVSEQKHRQGICPKGWHLPSDYEWTQLEQEVIKLTSSFADMTDINPTATPGSSWVDQSPPDAGAVGTEYRGTTHGKALKDPCETASGLTHRGASYKVSKGGFSLLLAGFISVRTGDNTVNGADHAKNGRLWTSSSVEMNNASSRHVSSSQSRVNQNANARNNLLSVRCKKDDVK